MSWSLKQPQKPPYMATGHREVTLTHRAIIYLIGPLILPALAGWTRTRCTFWPVHKSFLKIQKKNYFCKAKTSRLYILIFERQHIKIDLCSHRLSIQKSQFLWIKQKRKNEKQMIYAQYALLMMIVIHFHYCFVIIENCPIVILKNLYLAI